MKSATDWMDLILIPSTVVFLALLHRLDLLVVVVPVSIIAGYAMTAGSRFRNSGQRKI